MKEIEFNLLTEPWIRVRLRDNTVREVSLTEAPIESRPQTLPPQLTRPRHPYGTQELLLRAAPFLT